MAVGLLLAAGVAAWAYAVRERLHRQWMTYRVGAAASLDEARQRIAWFEAEPDRDAKLRELVRKWATGNLSFDYALAHYVGHAKSSEALRKAFSLEFAWREGLLVRWAHYWSWRAPQEPDRHIEEILAYVDLLDAAPEVKELSWREILDLQAILQLGGQPILALRLTPDNWRDRYHEWKRSRPATLSRVSRPFAPFPDWQGTVPE